MAKTNNLHIRIDPAIQKKAEKVLRKLGMSLPGAITVFLNQVSLKGGLPFEITLPEQEPRNLYPKYFYGIELPEWPHDAKEDCEDFQKVFTPHFLHKYAKWLNAAIASSKRKLEKEWNETIFWARVFYDDPEYGAFASFTNLFQSSGLKLEYCYSNNEVHGMDLPWVVGIALSEQDAKSLHNGEKPQVIFSLCRKLRGIFTNFEEKNLQIFEVFDEETEELMANIYDPNDPNFMTSDDY
ncbi:MAG: type II toxin-antitoxin system RelB/DinJ family antitoxin [Treponema sp.]|jgi:addiction module RelB/DinJ family antitoxin|nr:type II toxin-antitoxin system RelB/DinJ family antitoxin [Treponema sp.]